MELQKKNLEKAKEKIEEEKLKEELDEETRLKLEKEEKEKKEQEEYDQWKEFLVTVETGSKLDEDKDDENLLQMFLTFIKIRKIVSLEDVAMRFNLSNKMCIDRINSLLESGMLNGIIDDRGQFIFIETQEMQELVECIQKKGSFTRNQLIESFSDIIRLEPTESDIEIIKEEERGLLQNVNQDFENMISTENEEKPIMN